MQRGLTPPFSTPASLQNFALIGCNLEAAVFDKAEQRFKSQEQSGGTTYHVTDCDSHYILPRPATRTDVVAPYTGDK